MNGRTMAEIGRRYDERREATLQAIRDRKTSASMSGIEYFPKPWAELDMSDPYHLGIISMALTWDPETQQFTHAGLRPYSAEELELYKRMFALFRKPHEERIAELQVIETRLRNLMLQAAGPLYGDREPPTILPPSAVARIERILEGIDKGEWEDPDNGWWQTSTGVEFGTMVLNEIRAALAATPTPPAGGQ